MVHTYIHTGKHPQIQNKNKQNLEKREEGRGGEGQSREEPSRGDTKGQQQKGSSLGNVGSIVPTKRAQPNLNYQDQDGATSHPLSPPHTLFGSSWGTRCRANEPPSTLLDTHCKDQTQQVHRPRKASGNRELCPRQLG